jgi:hypothetical protein
MDLGGSYCLWLFTTGSSGCSAGFTNGLFFRLPCETFRLGGSGNCAVNGSVNNSIVAVAVQLTCRIGSGSFRSCLDFGRNHWLARTTVMNWTSSKTPLWKLGCEKLRKLDTPFKLRNVRTVEHMAFVQAFCIGFDWTSKQKGTSVIFYPPKS